MKYLLLFFFSIGLFAQNSSSLDTLKLGKSTFYVQKKVDKSSELQNYFQIDSTGSIFKRYTVEIYHDPVPYSSFFFKPNQEEGTFFQVSNLKDNNLEKRDFFGDSTFIANSITKLLLNEKNADDILIEQQMRSNKKSPDCMSELKTYAVSKFGGKEYGIMGSFPRYTISPINQIPDQSPSAISGEGEIVVVDNKCKIVSVKNERKRY